MNKTVVVTGSGQGLGLVLANTFASYGWKVIGTGLKTRPEDMDQGVRYVELDSSNPDATNNFWRQLKDEIGEQKVSLINNAGGYIGGELLELQPEDYIKQINSIYLTGVHMSRGLIANFNKARLFNMISASAMKPLKDNGAYGAAKTAAAHFFNSLQQQYPPEQYQITNLYPDKMATHGEDNTAMSPKDIAEFILSLAESETSFYLKDAYIYSLKK